MNYRALLGALLLCAPMSAQAAGVVPGTIFGGSSTSTNTATIAAFTVPPGEGDATIRLAIGTERNGTVPASYASATWNGHTFTLVAAQSVPGGTTSQVAALAILPMAERGVTADLVVNLNAAAGSLRFLAAVLEGVGAPEAICSPCGAVTLGTTVTTSITTVSPNAYVTDAFSASLGSNWAPAAGQTEQGNSTGGSQTTAASDGVGPVTPGAVSLTWGRAGTGANLAHVVVAFPVAAPPPPPPPPPPGPCAGDFMPPIADTGLIDVTTNPNCVGIVGDGVTDVTAALQACTSYFANHNKQGQDNSKESEDTLGFPDGDYLVSGQVKGMAPDGTERAYLGFRGIGSRGGARLILAENSPGFGDPNAEKAVLQFGNPGDATRPCCTGSAARNFLRNLSFVIRPGNPGARAVDYHGNNMVSVRELKVTAEAGTCKTGLGMTTKWPGPVMFKDIEIEGCATGIAAGYPYANLSFENVLLRNQTAQGADVFLQVVGFKNLVSEQSVPGVPAIRVMGQHEKAGPLVNVLGGQLAGVGTAAIKFTMLSGGAAQYRPQGFFRDVTTSGYTNALDNVGTMVPTLGAELATRPVSMVLPSAPTSLGLPFPAHPHMQHPNPADWVSIAAFGAIPNDNLDDTAAIQAAIDSGHKVVYCPAGIWTQADTIHFRGAIQRYVGFDCFHRALGTSMRVPTFKPAWIAEADLSSDFEIESLRMDRGDRTASPFPEPRFIHRSPHAVIMTDVLHVGSYVSEAGAGPVFVESSCCDQFRLLGGNDGYFRSVNVEDGPTPNSGDPTGYPDIECVGPGKCVAFGFKNENRFGPFMTARDGAQFESYNTFYYSDVVGGTSQGPLFECIESECSLSYAGYSGAKWSPQARVVRGGVEALLPVGAPGGSVSRSTFNTLFVERPL